jgi:hypothetical protein
MRVARGRAPRIAALLLALAALTLTLAADAGPPDTARCKQGGWKRLAFRNQGECVSLLASGGFIWNLADDFISAPSPDNPLSDLEGHPGVWHFLAALGLARDPQTYEPFIQYTLVDDNHERWENGPVEPFAGIGFLRHVHRVLLHPGEGRLTVVGWRSPVDGRVRVRGAVAHDGSQACGTGVAWSIDAGTTPLAGGTLSTGAAVSFDASAQVRVGDFLYVALDPHGDLNCDSTFLDLTISGPVHGQ